MPAMQTLRDQILDAALEDAAFDGWTQGTLARAAARLGLGAADVKRAFPAGVVEALSYHSQRADQRMTETLARDYNLATMKIRDRIATAVMVRLRANQPHREAIRRAVALFALPWHAAEGLKNLYATVDAMWYAAGDTSTDFNFYTKRLTLAKVYSSTLYVWLDDATPDLADTEAFLRRRIENVMQFEKFKAKAKESFSKFESWLPPAFRA